MANFDYTLSDLGDSIKVTYSGTGAPIPDVIPKNTISEIIPVDIDTGDPENKVYIYMNNGGRHRLMLDYCLNAGVTTTEDLFDLIVTYKATESSFATYDFTATAGQATAAIPFILAGAYSVYKDGVLLSTGYTATAAQELTFSPALSAGNVMRIQNR